MLLLKGFEALAQLLASHRRPGGRILSHHHVVGGDAGGHCDRIAAERGDGLRGPGLGDFVACDGRAERESVGNGLRHHHDIRLDVPVLDPEPLSAGTAESRLHLVANEHAPVTANDFRGALKIARWRNDVTTDALNRLGHERSGLAICRRLDCIFEVVAEFVDATLVARRLERAAIRIRRNDVFDPGNPACERPPRSVRREVGRQHAAARVAVPQGDDLVSPRVHARDHHRGFDRFGSTVGEDRSVEFSRCEGRHPLGHLDVVLAQVQRGNVS